MSVYENALFDSEEVSDQSRSIGHQASQDSTQNESSILDTSEVKQGEAERQPRRQEKMDSFVVEDSLNQSDQEEISVKAALARSLNESSGSNIVPTTRTRQVIQSSEEEGNDEEEEEDDDDDDEESGSEEEDEEDEEDESEDDEDEEEDDEDGEENESLPDLPLARSPVVSKASSAPLSKTNSTKIFDLFDNDNTKENLSIVDKSASDFSALENTNKKEASSLMVSRISDGINRNLVINDSVEQSDLEAESAVEAPSSTSIIGDSIALDGSSIRQPVKRNPNKLLDSSGDDARPASASQSDRESSKSAAGDDIELLDGSSLNVPRNKHRNQVLDSSGEDHGGVIDITRNESPPKRQEPPRSSLNRAPAEEEIVVLSDSEEIPPRSMVHSRPIQVLDSPVVQPKPGEMYASPNMFSRKLNDQKPVASWSPNYEQVKAKIQKSVNKNQPRKIQMIDLSQNEFNRAPGAGGDDEDDANSIDKLKNLKFQANVIRTANDAQNTRHYSYEHQLKELSEQMISVLEEKPDPDQINDEFLQTDEAKELVPKGLKVKLLNHQYYSLKWLKWREQTYPFGGILADDMGLGKTLTILSYLKLQKDRREEAVKAKINELNNDDGEDDEDDDEREQRRKRFEKKYSSRRAFSKPLKTLIILPASLMHQWEGEIKNRFERDTFKYLAYHGNNRNKFSYNLDDYDIVFTTYELVSREVALVDKQGNDLKVSDSPLGKIKWKRIILDEAHRIKNHATKGSKAICFLRAKYRIAITGTPIHNSLTDFYSLVKFLHFEPLSDLSLWQYIFASEKFAKSLPKHNAVERQDRLNNWLGLLSSYLILRRTKADKIKGTEQKIVDLPEKSVETIRFGLNEYEKKIYELIFNESKEKVDDFLKQRLLGKNSGGNFVSEILVYLLRLRQACCHMSLLNECIDKALLQNMKLEADGLENLMQNMSLGDSSPNQTALEPDLSGIKSKDVDLSQCFEKSWVSTKLRRLIDMLTKILDENPEDKVIVVSQWTSMLRLVGRYLEQEEIGFCEINGEIQLAKRNEIVERFNKKFCLTERIMLLSLTAGGVGLNLIGANHMFLLDIHWNPALEQQAADRIYRVGQKKDVFVYKFICENTIEERIMQIQQFKMDIANKVCSASAAGANVANMPNTKLTINDFKLLFKGFDSDSTQQQPPSH